VEKCGSLLKGQVLLSGRAKSRVKLLKVCTKIPACDIHARISIASAVEKPCKA
jgi:hypothetical protein